MDCSRIDDLLVDYIYQELNPSQVELFEAHLQGCERCTQEVSAYESTRSMFASLPEEDPPAQISALLLQEASRAVQPPELGFWEKLRVGLRSLAMHPATTAAVTLTLVLGISFYVYKNNPAPGDSPKIDLPTPLMGEDSPTATISSMPEGAAVSEKGAADKRGAQPSEAIGGAANEDEAARDVLDGVTSGKSGLARKADRDEEGRASAVTSRKAARNTVVGSTRGRLRARQVMYGKDGYKNVAPQAAGPADTVAQKPVVMPPPPAVAPTPSAAAASERAPVRPTVKLRKRARRMTRKGPGTWDDAFKGEAQARAPKAPPAPRADLARAAGNKKNAELDNRAVQGAEKKGKGRTVRYAHAKSKPRPKPRARPARVARRPAPKKSPAPPMKKPMMEQKAKKKQASKAANKQSSALSFLFLGNKAAKSRRCDAALEHFNRALLQDRSLRTRVASAMRTCTSRMNLSQLLAAQRRHQMLAGLLEPDIKRARNTQYAARKRAAKKKAKKTKQKKARSKSAPAQAIEAPSSK